MTKRQITVTMEMLSSRFNKPLCDVATELGVCMTFLKKACRRHGIKRWPFRKVQAQIHRLERAKIREADRLRMAQLVGQRTQGAPQQWGHPFAQAAQSYNPFLASVMPPPTAQLGSQQSQSQGQSGATLSYSSSETAEVKTFRECPSVPEFNFASQSQWGLATEAPILSQCQPEQCSSDTEQSSTPAVPELTDADLLTDDLLNEVFDLENGCDFFLQSPAQEPKEEQPRLPQYAGLPLKLDMSDQTETVVRHECEV